MGCRKNYLKRQRKYSRKGRPHKRQRGGYLGGRRPPKNGMNDIFPDFKFLIYQFCCRIKLGSMNQLRYNPPQEFCRSLSPDHSPRQMRQATVNRLKIRCWTTVSLLFIIHSITYIQKRAKSWRRFFPATFFFFNSNLFKKFRLSAVILHNIR
jgi:hypothetical protein